MATQNFTDSDMSSNKAIPIRSIEALKTPRSLRSLAFSLFLFVILTLVALAFIPWQQSVTGTGRVMVLSPMDRPQNIEAQIPGRLVKWHVQEGKTVKAGQTIAELETSIQNFWTNPRLSASVLSAAHKKPKLLLHAHAL
jgi:multidrug efflux pump subunit AcrA (membrane-fusion protein)